MGKAISKEVTTLVCLDPLQSRMPVLQRTSVVSSLADALQNVTLLANMPPSLWHLCFSSPENRVFFPPISYISLFSILKSRRNLLKAYPGFTCILGNYSVFLKRF